MIDKERVKDLFIQGYKYNTIARMLNSKPETIRKCIQRNFNDLKQERSINKARNKDINKVINHENNQFMSDKEFVKRNRSIYITEENGDIVVKEEFKNILSWDVPKKLINECSSEKLSKNMIKSGYRQDNSLFNY